MPDAPVERYIRPRKKATLCVFIQKQVALCSVGLTPRQGVVVPFEEQKHVMIILIDLLSLRAMNSVCKFAHITALM